MLLASQQRLLCALRERGLPTDEAAAGIADLGGRCACVGGVGWGWGVGGLVWLTGAEHAHAPPLSPSTHPPPPPLLAAADSADQLAGALPLLDALAAVHAGTVRAGGLGSGGDVVVVAVVGGMAVIEGIT